MSLVRVQNRSKIYMGPVSRPKLFRDGLTGVALFRELLLFLVRDLSRFYRIQSFLAAKGLFTVSVAIQNTLGRLVVLNLKGDKYLPIKVK